MGLGQIIMNVLGAALGIVSIVAIFLATNPITIAVSALMILIDAILNVINIHKNIKTIDELKKKKEEILEYYKPGGQFEQDLQKICDLTLQIIENFYMFIITYRSIINELAINLNLLILSDVAKEQRYGAHLILLQDSIADEEF